MEWSIGVEPWSKTFERNFECNRKLNSGGELCLMTRGERTSSHNDEEMH